MKNPHRPALLLALLLAATLPVQAQTAVPAAPQVPAKPASAPELALKIEHDITTLSADGITRNVRYAERLVRQGDQVWLARVLPPNAHEEAEHAAGAKSHKHMDVAAAARWVQRAPDGTLRVRLVNAHDKLAVDVPQADWANAGFDGQWASALHLLDPARVARMTPLARPAPTGSKWVESRNGQMTVRVLWDDKGQYPRRVESSHARGTSRSVTVATPEALPKPLPWDRLQGYAQKEYSDLLD